MSINRKNKPWDNNISDEEIFNKEFSIGWLILTNQHLEEFRELKDKVLSTYEVEAEFIYLGYNGDEIISNNQRLVWRPSKDKGFLLGDNVEILKHNLPSKGGSNKYPSVGYNGAKCILRFISYGLPFIDEVNGWKINIIKMNKQN